MDVGESDGAASNQGSQGGGGIFDMFGGLFGGGQQQQQQRGGGRRQQSRGRGGNREAIKRNMPRTQDLMVSMTVSLEDFYNGGEKTFSFKRNVICSKCRGLGGTDTSKCTVLVSSFLTIYYVH